MSSRAARPRPRRRLVGVSAVAVGALLTTYAGALRSVTYARAVTPAAASCSPGATLVADDTALQAAIASSVDGSVICVTADITLTATLAIDDTTLTLEGATPATQLSGGGVTRILLADFRDVADDTLTLRNLTFTQGSSLNADDSDGGAIAVFGNSRLDTFSAEDVTIKNSYSFEDGGGIALSSMNSIRFTRSKFYDNRAASDSGAVEINFANRVVVEESVFQRNSAIGEDGGAISLQDALDVRITDNTVFQENEAANDGGAVELFSGSNYLLVQDTTFTDDSTGDEGGSLFAQDVAEVRLANIAVSGAFAGDNGGAIYLLDDSVVYITNSTFLSNGSVDDGGAIHIDGSDDTVALTGITFEENVTSASGGGLYLTGLRGPVQLTSVNARNNSAGSSGGFLRAFNISAATVTINGMDSQGNSANSDGGSIKQTSGTLSVVDATFRDDSATDSGAIYAAGLGAFRATGSQFINNRATDDAGAVRVLNTPSAYVSSSLFQFNQVTTDDGGGLLINNVDDTIVLTDLTFDRNSSGAEGGGVKIVNSDGFVSISGVTAVGNSAGTLGGALYLADPARSTIENSTFTSNSADDTAGGLWLKGVDHTLNFVTVAANTARHGGGVFADDNSGLVILNSVVAGNTATGVGSDVALAGTATLDDSFSLFTSAAAVSGATIDGPGSIFGAPKLNGLADNGGPTLTMLPQWDSPAFQAGDPN